MFGYFGITNNGVNLAINLLGLFLAIVWLSLIYWTRADAKRRISDPVLVLCATALLAVPFVGTIIYMIVRPPEYLEDIRERELEMAAAEARLAQLSYLACQQLRQRGREGLPDLPELPQPPARAVRDLPAPARDALDASARTARRRSSARSTSAGAARPTPPRCRPAPDAVPTEQGERPRWSARSSSPSPTPTPAA